MHRQWGSDEDLVRDVGLAVEPELREQPDSPSSDLYAPIQPMSSVGHERQRQWEQQQQEDSAQDSAQDSVQESAQASGDLLIYRTESPPHESRKLSLYDVGGLLEDSAGTSSGSFRRGSGFTSSSMDASTSQAPQASRKASTNGVRRGSTALLQDLGGLLGPLNSKSSVRSKHRTGTELQPIPQSHQEHHTSRSEASDLVLMDPGGLLR